MTADPQTPVEELEGRDLDKAVHREVFGWTFTEDMPVGTGEHVIDGDEEWRECHPTAAPLYSSEIRDAWEVLERFDHQDLLHDSEARDSRWSVTVRRYLPREKYIEEWAEHSEVEVAICRAALRAVRQ